LVYKGRADSIVLVKDRSEDLYSFMKEEHIVFDNLITFFLLAGLGVFFKWKKPGDIDPDMARYVINTIIIKFFLPALCFKVIATSRIDINTVLIPVTAISIILPSIIISFIVLQYSKNLYLYTRRRKEL
jgi:predicted permease